MTDSMHRRRFIQTGLTLGAASALAVPARAAAERPGASTPAAPSAPDAFDPSDWRSVRGQFSLSTSHVHLATFLLASHPRPVADAIARMRQALDENPADYWHEKFMTVDMEQRTAAAEYMGGSPEHIALTDSTTMGLGLLYGGLRLDPEAEIVTTTHDHYSTHMSLQYRAERTGNTVRHVALYDDPAQASVDEIVARMRKAVTDRTRLLAVTWVHSSTGVKLPIAAMSSALREINARRDANDQVLFCVDGVHGFGIEDVKIDELGCDFFVAGTHKWIFGPRGTGVIWGRPDAWKWTQPVIPSFGPVTGAWLGRVSPDVITPGDIMTPGGFHSFEHRWAVGEAFRFHLAMGKTRVQQRIHALNTYAKLGLAEMPHVRLLTPMSEAISAGIIAFDVDGMDADTVVERLYEQNVIGAASPYRESFPRIAPSLINDEGEIDRALAVIRTLV